MWPQHGQPPEVFDELLARLGGLLAAFSAAWPSGASILGVADDPEPRPTQLTRPRKGKPVEIPVPSERDVMGLLEKVARAPAEAGEK